MDEKQIREAVLEALGDVAPEADLNAINPEKSLREQLDIDSFDFLTFLQNVHDRLGIDVPESDYAELETLRGAVAYLSSR
jgi:acyl carrier protein